MLTGKICCTECWNDSWKTENPSDSRALQNCKNIRTEYTANTCVIDVYLGRRPRKLLPSRTQFTWCRYWRQTGEKRGSRSEGGTNLAKMIKIGTCRRMGVPRSSLTKTPHTITGVRISVESCSTGVPRRNGHQTTWQHAEHVISSARIYAKV